MAKQGRGKRRRLNVAQKALVQGAEAQLMVARQLRIAMRLDWRLDVDDVRSIAQEALVLAALRFDPSEGTPFVGFAYSRVKGAVLRHMHKEWFHRYRRAVLTGKRHHAYPNGDEGAPEEQEQAMRQWAKDQVLSWCLADALNRDEETTPEEHAASAELRDVMVSAWKTLPADHAQLVLQLYQEGLSLRDVCKSWNKSFGAIQRMHADALARMRLQLLKVGLSEYPADTIRPML